MKPPHSTFPEEIKGKDDELIPDDGGPQHSIAIAVCKKFENVEHKLKIANHDLNAQLCQILCNNVDREQM